MPRTRCPDPGFLNSTLTKRIQELLAQLADSKAGKVQDELEHLVPERAQNLNVKGQKEIPLFNSETIWM